MSAVYQKIEKEKLPIALGITIWLFLFLTTISKTYFYFLRNNLEFDVGFIVYRSFLIWGVIAFFIPAFILLAKKVPFRKYSYKTVLRHFAYGILFVPLHAAIFVTGIKVVYGEGTFIWAEFFNSVMFGMAGLGIVSSFSYWAVVSAYYFKKYYEQYTARQVASTKMEAELASIRLHVLKVQLHPHFLFNTLHNIHSLMHEAPQKAQRVLQLLKEFLQVSLNRVGQHQVRLREELNFTGLYLEIEKTRFSNRLTVRKDIDEKTLDAMVPSFLLQPLVENAVKHGISKKMNPGILNIASRIKGNRLCLTIEDNGPGMSGTINSKGIGLNNIQQRLLQLYPEPQFELLRSALGGLKVEIEIPLQRNEP